MNWCLHMKDIDLEPVNHLIKLNGVQTLHISFGLHLQNLPLQLPLLFLLTDSHLEPRMPSFQLQISLSELLYFVFIP